MPTHSHQPSRLQTQQQSTVYQGFDPDDMELDMDQSTSAPSSGAPTPPDTPISTPGYPSPTSYSAVPSPHGSQPASPISAFDTTTVLPSRAHHHHHHHHHHSTAFGGLRSSVGAGPGGAGTRAEDAFNAYAGYSDYSSLLPGSGTLSGPNAMFMQQQSGMALGAAVCAPTALLLSNSTGNTPDSTPASSRVASPIPGGSASGYRSVAPNAQASSSNAGASTSSAGASGSGSASTTARASTTLSRPATSLLLSKPFKCPKPNCNKSYKQANGLKYHMTHGSCNFAPPKDLEHLQELLASKRSEKARAAGVEGTVEGAEVTLSESELREVEKEAERRLRPYACGVADCQRRYKNMNGLRECFSLSLSASLVFVSMWCAHKCSHAGYHYQHSGDHGAIGLALLASGQHECLQHNNATPSRAHSHSCSGSSSGSHSNSHSHSHSHFHSYSSSRSGPGSQSQPSPPRTPITPSTPSFSMQASFSALGANTTPAFLHRHQHRPPAYAPAPPPQ